ncbi:MAG: cyclic nucleotide-binding domain-containing protein [Elusimicrobia bacterium]|nr:cyclic nucleotide-binding domain-containing protein [Elusimicrobiota bacterium]
MDPKEKLQLLKSVRLLDQIPEKQLAALGEFLTPVEIADGAVIFEEGAKGDSLYFVTGGRVRISKRVSAGDMKDLAILGPGDCFGEMALVEDVTRSAQAAAAGATTLFRLGREDMNRWLKSHPELAVDFFAELVQVLSRRLRRTSSELTLIYDLSHMLLEPWESGKALLAKVLGHVVPHLEGDWSAAAHLYNAFNDEMDFVAGCGPFDFARVQGQLPPVKETRNIWIEDHVYYVSLPGAVRPHGYLIFRSEADLKDDQRADIGRTLTTVAQLLATALENIGHRVEEGLRERLKQNSPHGAYL